jgi:hypothetical protein
MVIRSGGYGVKRGKAYKPFPFIFFLAFVLCRVLVPKGGLGPDGKRPFVVTALLRGVPM